MPALSSPPAPMAPAEPTQTAPAHEGLALPSPDDSLPALDRLMLRMQGDHDFPALTGAVTRIQRIAASDTESLASLSAEILKDVSMTHKLLRMVNTVHFSSFAAGPVNTVSRAVAVVGFAGIRNMALSLLLLEQLQNKAHAVRLRQELLLALMAAQLAQQLTPWAADEEEAYLAALFHNLGRLLTEFYLPAEAAAIRCLCGGSEGAPEEAAQRSGPSPESAARQVLGLGFEALGLGIAKAWGLPDGLRHALARPTTAVPGKPSERGPERHRWLAAMASEVALAMQDADPVQARRRVRQVAEQHAGVLDMTAPAICSAADLACAHLGPLVQAIGLRVEPGTPGHRMLAYGATKPALRASSPPAAPAPQGTAPRMRFAADVDHTRADMLSAGIEDVMATLSGDEVQLNVVLRMVMETALRALGLRRVGLLLRDPRGQVLAGRFGLGADVDSWLRRALIAAKPVPGETPDLFCAACHEVRDTVVDDARDPCVLPRLPAWFGEVPVALGFVLLPMVMKGETFAMIYGDAVRPGGLALSEREMALLRTLRNQAVMAFKQAA